MDAQQQQQRGHQDRAPALSIINPNPQRLPGPPLLHDILRDNSPHDAPAIDYQGPAGSRKSISYSELHSRAEALSRRILAALPEGHFQGQLVVPLLLPQYPELYISQLAALKAGGAFCPLNLDAPPERVKFIFADVSAKVVITNQELRSKVDALDSDVTILLVDDEEPELASGRSRSLARDVRPEDLAYVMYTSGSTGTPKGVGISHDAATQALRAHDRHIPRFSRFLNFAAPTFDVSVFEIFFPLFRGATLVSCNRADMINDLPAVLRDMEVDACELTPTVAGSLLRTRENAPGLRLLLTIGEMLTGPVVREFGGDADRPSILWGMYGPTEDTIHCTLQPSYEASCSPNNVGFPLDTVSAYVLEPLAEDGGSGEFKVLPFGETGELAVGGHQTAVGYINRPAQTAKVFIDTPYGRLYRTGDKAKMTENGTIECFGRISDGQVKLRGQRIELGEIEQAVLRTPGCHGAVASVIQGIIVVFCERDDPDDDVTEQILQTCRNWLPVFMVPGDIISMKSFPRLPSGKVDRKKLKADYEASRGEAADSSSEFKDAVEQRLAQLAEEALGVRISPSSTLSASGVDSLGAIKLASRLRQQGFVVGAVDILSSKTISHLRSRIRQQDLADKDAVAVDEAFKKHDSLQVDLEEISKTASVLGVNPDAIQAVAPCAPVQLSMLAETLSNPEAYCNWIELQVPSTFTDEKIASWFHHVARCNDILRTGFTVLEGQFKQLVWKELDPAQIKTVNRLDRGYQLDEKGFARPFSVHILSSQSRQHTSVLVQMHHALYDGWSFDLLLADLNLLAQDEEINESPSFRHVSDYYQSSDFCRHADAARSYWAEHLLGYQPSPMPQLLAKQVNDNQTLSAQRTLDVEGSLIQSLSAKLEISPQVLFQACLLWLWGAILGTEDVVIGNVTSGRTIPVQSIEDVMGPCLTTIPLRTRIKQARTVRELLENIHASNRESLAHCTLPLADIKKAAGIAPGQALFDALFVYQESIPSRTGDQKSRQVQQVSHEDYLETKLLAEVEPLDKGFQLRVTYHANVFHHDYMQLFLRQFESILAHIVKNIESDISSIITWFSENHLSASNRTPKTLEGTPDLATIFEDTAAKQPEKLALCFAEAITEDGSDLKTMSYGELNSLANKISRLLKSSGATEGQPVAIIMEKSILLYAGILAILKAGCAYLPLLPSTPLARINTILSQADVRLCVSDTVSSEILPELQDCSFVSLHDEKLDEYDEHDIGTKTDASRVANIIYTSGSTGVPKGVCVTQLNICSNLDVLSRIYPISGDSRMLQSCSQAFDVSVFEILFALTRGMCLCTATNDVLFADLELAIRAMDVTHLSMTPTVASLVNPGNVPRVEFLVTAGEPMTSEVARKWMGKLYQGYGPSETTNICSVKKMVPGDHIRHLGHTFENTSALVLAPDSFDTMPIGCVGEFCFGGDQVVAGYLDLAEVTNAKFIEHPKYGRIYRSGDTGRMLADGSLLIVGRIDDQVKLRGQRIELGEVNAVVSTATEVFNSVTMIVGQSEGVSQQLACFYVPRTLESDECHALPADSKTSKLNESIYHTLKFRLPSYMVPSYLIPVSRIPMTPSGKVDKTNLKSIFIELDIEALQAFSANSWEADNDVEWSQEERRVADVVANTLDAPPQHIGRWTPLTSLGLDSISAITLAKGLQKTFSQRIPISAILQNSSVARLAALVSGQQANKATDEKPLTAFSSSFVDDITQKMRSKHMEIEAVLPCTPLQEAMLASSADDASYLNKMLLRINSGASAMQQYWSVMFQRHGILRTSFFSTHDREHAIAQCILKSWESKWLFFDTVGDSLDEAVRRHSKTVPPAIDSGTPPVSLAVIQDGNNTYLSFICHHALYDGVAIARLLEEIEQVAMGTDLPSPPSYEPFLREMLALPESTDTFWKEYLQGLRTKSLPRVPGPDIGRDVLDRPLALPFSDIERSLKAMNVSLLSLLQASWSTLLCIIQQSDDICFGNVVNGRSGTVDRVDELVAPCFNTIPSRIDFQDKKRNIDALKSFQLRHPQLLQYQFTPLRRIQTLCSANGTKLFDTLLLLQQPPRPLDKNLWTLEKDDGEMDFPLVCEVTPDPVSDRLGVKVHFDRSHISSEFASIICDILSHILSHLLQYPSSHIMSTGSLPTELRARLDAMNLVQAADAPEQTLQDGESMGEWSEHEMIVRSVFSRISGAKEEKITRHMTMFQLGLDSINAVQLASVLRNEGFPAISASDLMENPTCSKLAAKLKNSQQDTDDPAQYDIAEFQRSAKALLEKHVLDWEAVEAILPCTSLQMGMLTEFINSKGKDYFNFVDFKVEACISTSALRDAWEEVTKAHPMLRTGFTPLDHEDASFCMLQYKFEDLLLPVSVEDNTRFNPSTWKREISQSVLNDLRQPPWGVAIVEGSEGVEMNLAIHHILYDAQALQTLLSDITKALHGEAIVVRTDLETVVQDIITQTNETKKTGKDFWQQQAGKAAINTFPVMTPLKEDKREILVRSKSSSLSFNTIEEAVKDAGLTVQAVAQAAWLRILSAYLGEPRVIFGVIISGRNSEVTRDAVFPCIATLPVVGMNSSSNDELLQFMMRYNAGLQRHQRTPLTDVQRWVGHPTTKLFDTLLVYQRFERGHEQLHPWQIVNEQATVDYPISIEIEPVKGLLEFRVTFFSDVLPTEQAAILLQQFDAVLSDLAQNPQGNDEGLLDHHQELFAVIPPEEPLLKSDVTFLHEFVESKAQRYPDKIALDFVSGFENGLPVSRKWSYKNLDDNGNRVANMLSPHVRTGDIVAVCFDKCPEAHFAMLGILKAGCSLLALDPGAPSSRKEFILQDSGAAVLLTDKSRSLALEFKATVPVIAVDDEALLVASTSAPTLTRPVTPEDRSYCLYTSGTTGTPKGCELTHENAVQALLAFQRLFDGHWDANSKWLQFASYHFDVSVLEQYWSWSVGITLVGAPRDVILEDLAGIISRLEITHIDLTPSLARLLHPDDVPSLCKGVFITGGEQLKQEILDVWGPKRVIHNFYGPTEATIGVTTYSRVPQNGKSSNIGKQFANVGSFVLRPGTETPVLKGGVGELCVSGKLVGKGYLNRPDLTTERFPTLKAFNERVYRTGDLVRVLHDGCFDFLGRADDQVKLRGQRLEIGEINHCIKSGVSDVSDVVTVVVRNEKQQKDLLVSFVVTGRAQKTKELNVISGDEAVAISQKVQQACRNKLPGYMVPTYVLLLPFIPLSPNNKAEVKELKALFNKLSPEQLVAPSSASNADLGDLGKKIFKALASVTGAAEESISASTNIFDLGIDSISVLRLARALKREGIPSATPSIILKNPTISDFAQALKSSQRLTESSTGILEARQSVEACQHRNRGLVCRTLGITPDQIEYIAPCSALQQGMISRSKTDEHEGAYFNSFRFELAEGVSLSKLRTVWETMVQKHSVMRTRFVSTTEGFIQVAVKDAVIPWKDTMLRESDDLDATLVGEHQSWVEENSQNITRPVEFLGISGKTKHLLVIHIFHGIYDANSFDLMLDEVAALFKGDADQESAPKFFDALLHGPLRNLSSSKSFWMAHLQGVSFSAMPKLSDSPSHEDLSISRVVSFEALDKVRKTLGVTQQSMIQALWASVLQQHLTYGVTFGVIVSGRSIELENADRVIGPLFNTIPYHHRAVQGDTWASCIQRTHEFNTSSLPLQHTPLRDIQKWCSRGKPLFDSLFSFQRGSVDSTNGLWIEIESNVNPDYPLAFEATLLPDGKLHALVVAQKDIANSDALSGLLDEFERIVQTVIDNPQGLSTIALADSQNLGSQMPNGDASHAQNHSSGSNDGSFEWLHQSKTIRREMALLADVEESSITQDTTLLELGLDSIDTIKLAARLRRADVVLSNSELIRGQSVAKLTAILLTKEARAVETTDSGYSSDTDNTSAPLKAHLANKGHDLSNVEQVLAPTPLQDSMVSEMIISDFQRYFNHDVLELSPDVDIDRLKAAWETVIKNSPILRTAFVEIEDREFDFVFAQLVRKDGGSVLHEVEVQSLDDIDTVMEQARMRAKESQARSSLLQITFARSSHQTYMVLSIAHALYDGWSLGLLHQDLEAAYRGTFKPRSSYTGYLNEILRSSKVEASKFWSDYVSGAEPSLFPSSDEATVSTVKRDEITLATPASTLKAFCKRHAVSQQAVAQACWAAVLAVHCQRLDVTFGVVLSGRETEASEAMLFPTMNTVPVRAVFYGTVSTFLRYMQDNMTSISQFQHFPLRKIQALVQGRQTSLFNTLFILQKSNSGVAAEETAEPLMKSVDGSSAVEYPVCVEMETIDNSIVWRAACDDGYLSPQGTNHLLKELDNVLDFLMSSSDNEILKFSNDGVSVCGLPAFQPNEYHDANQEQTQENDEDSQQWSPTEEAIREVLAEMSGVQKDSILKGHSLYHLGLDSISAIKVTSALRKRDIAVTVRGLIQAPSIKDMAAKASKSTTTTTSTTSSTASLATDSTRILDEFMKDINLTELLQAACIDIASVVEALPATAMQTHVLSVWQNTNGTVFFPEFQYILSGVSEISVIYKAWEELIVEQAALRTALVATGSRTVPLIQIVLKANVAVANPFCKLSIDKKGDKWSIRLKIHHALYDGVSLPLIMDRFRDLITSGGQQAKQEDVLPAWKSLLASSVSGPTAASRKAFWVRYLEGAKFSPFPSRGTDTGSTSERVSFLSRAAMKDTEALKQISAQSGISIQAVFLAAYARVLASASGSEDLVLGVYLANRSTEQQLPWPTLCLVPLRVRIPRDAKITDVATDVQRDLRQISALENISVGLWEIQEWTGVVVNSFVNFLSLPDEPRADVTDDVVSLKQLGFDEATAAGVESTVVDPNELPWLNKNAVRDAYPVAVDIEASLKTDGSFDIGVFGPREKLGETGAGDLVKHIVDALSV